MRALGILLAASLLASPALGAPRPFVGELFIAFGPEEPPYFEIWRATATGTGVANVNASSGGLRVGSLTLGGGTFSTVVTVPLSSVLLTTNASIRATLVNGPGSFAGLGDATPPGGGVMPISGRWKLCLFAPGCLPGLSIVVPLSANEGATGVGVGGTIVETGAVNVTVRGLGPWTQGTATIMNVNTTEGLPTPTFTQMGFQHGPASATSTANQPSGAIRLVTPIDVRTSLTTALPQLPGFGVLTLRFVPEPGTLLVFASGIATLAVLGRRRLRR